MYPNAKDLEDFFNEYYDCHPKKEKPMSELKIGSRVQYNQAFKDVIVPLNHDACTLDRRDLQQISEREGKIVPIPASYSEDENFCMVRWNGGDYSDELVALSSIEEIEETEVYLLEKRVRKLEIQLEVLQQSFDGLRIVSTV